MSYLVLARSWRPQTFDEVVGQRHVTRTLKNAILQGRVAHAYLFTGPRGVGKTSLARILAKAVNCVDGPTAEPCGQCVHCLEIRDGSSLDVQEIDGASNRGIEEIRELRENVRYLPSGCRFKIYIIDEVHMLTKEAFNALLKTLEEPPAHVMFIFATTEVHKLPPTILSRCQKFLFRRVGTGDLQEHLKRILEKEGIEFESAALAILARQADGSVRDSLSLTDQVISYGDRKVTAELVKEILGMVDRLLLLGLIGAMAGKDLPRIVETLEDVFMGGYDLRRFYFALVLEMRALLVRKLGAAVDEGDTDDEEATRSLLDRLSMEWLHAAQHELLNLDAELRYASDPRLVLELGLLKIAHLGDFYGLDALPPLGAVSTPDATPSRREGPAPASESSSVREPGTVYEKASDSGTVENEPIDEVVTLDSAPESSAPGEEAPGEEAFAGEEVGGSDPSERREALVSLPFEVPRFLDALRLQKPSLAFILKTAELTLTEEDVLLMRIPGGPSFNSSMVKDAREELADLASEIAGRKVAVKIEEGGAPAPVTIAQETLDESLGQMQKRALEHPIIEDIRTVFRGELIGYQAPRPLNHKEGSDG